MNQNEILYQNPNIMFSTSGSKGPWKELPWREYENKVGNMQRNIYNACKAGDIAAARNWQNYLINCYEAKLVAVRQITQLNKGKNTPGHDKYLALNDTDRFYLAASLTIDGNTSLIRRTFVPKPGSVDLRPLGIPTIFDRCKQQLVKLAIEPEWEARFEAMSFGFRPGRKAADATQRIRSHMVFKGPSWVLDADIAKCFDCIRHDYLLSRLNNALPIIRAQIEAWLKAGVIDKDGFIDNPLTGTPQGGPISPLLCNIALDGIQGALFQALKDRFGYDVAKSTLYVRYADDLVFLGPTQEVVLFAKAGIQNYLSQIGLSLSEKKTRVILTLDISDPNKPIQTAFDFLGFTFKSRLMGKRFKNNLKVYPPKGSPGSIASYSFAHRFKTTMVPSKTRIDRHKASIKAIVANTSSPDELCKILNPRIIGWTNYFRFSDGRDEDLPRKMDLWMNSVLRKWIRRSTKQRGKVTTFWRKDSKDWIFEYEDKNGIKHSISKYSNYHWNIIKYRPFKIGLNPYDIYIAC